TATKDKTIAVHVRHIREKLEINHDEPRYIKAVWGHGYVMEGEKK
ncbi:MAG: winged helix-turn-helix domain-containing protein, partial [Clostridia bacterium]|nr:winged helix-turn-helix domain-containing protein [Clostridia bacterium]